MADRHGVPAFSPPDASRPDSPSPEPPSPDSRPNASTPAAPSRRRSGTGRRLLLAVAALVVVALGLGGWYAMSLYGNVKNIHRTAPLPTAGRPTAGTTGALNYVLIGSDSRDPNAEHGRSDTLMVVHLQADRRKAYVISFPRDMYVEIPGHGKNKINAAYSLGGQDLVVRTMEQLLGTRMDHLAIMDFAGFIGVTDDLGGVQVDNKQAFTSHGYGFPKGRITIKGQQALWFVRERHALAHGDLDRAENQRNVLKAIVEKGLSGSTLADPAKFSAFVGAISKHLTVDGSLTDAEIRATGLSLRLTGKDIVLLQAPVAGFASVGGQDVDLVDAAKLRELATAVRTDTLGAYVAKHP